MTTKRKIYKVRLTPEEAQLVLTVIEAQHEGNTGDLRGTWGYQIKSVDGRAALKAENAALRQVRDALKRALPPTDLDKSLFRLLKEARAAATQEGEKE